MCFVLELSPWSELIVDLLLNLCIGFDLIFYLFSDSLFDSALNSFWRFHLLSAVVFVAVAIVATAAVVAAATFVCLILSLARSVLRLLLFDGIQTVCDTFKWKNDLAVDLFSKDEATVLLICISVFFFVYSCCLFVFVFFFFLLCYSALPLPLLLPFICRLHISTSVVAATVTVWLPILL